MAINNEPTIQPRTVTGIFTNYIAKVLPLAFDDSMSYYECLCALLNYINDTIVPDINNTNAGLKELQEFYEELQTYVNTYFDNLDVQEEINKKLDAMAQDGQLQQLLELQYTELENEVNNTMTIISNALNDRLDEQDTKINNATSGSPLVASSTAGMTDTTRIYVNTTDGKWYYYNGSAWTVGGTYQGTTVNESDPTIAEMNARINQYMQYYYFNENNSFTTPFALKSGQKLHLVITSINNTIVPFTVGYNQDTYGDITTTGTHVKTVTHDGAIRFYFSSAGNVQGYCYIENILQTSINTNKSDIDDLKYNYIPNITSIDKIQLKKKRIYENFSNLTTKTYNFTSNATIETIDNYESTSSVSLPTPVIRVRDNLGNLLYNNLTIENYDTITTQDARALYSFDKNGKFLRALSYKNVKDRNTIIASDEYYLILNKFPTVNDYRQLDWILNPINIEWLNTKNIENENVYYVGSGKDFDTFTEMLIALENDSTPKTVYIDPGEYNIFEEMGGADYMTSLIDTASGLNWRDVCHVVPENTKIIGIGKVVLKWEATDQEMISQQIAFLFSPLNVSGNCYIENINVIAQNCRYAVHDETSGLSKYNGAIHTYKNCTFQYKNSTYGVYICFGSGHNQDMTLTFDNCKFINYGQTIWSTHDWNYSANNPATININNCIFTRENESLTNGYVRFSSADTVGKKDNVRINNSFINGDIQFSTEGTSNVRQGYDVTLIGCNNVNVNYSEYVTTQYGITEYNVSN